jgi:hypothetical protein
MPATGAHGHRQLVDTLTASEPDAESAVRAAIRGRQLAVHSHVVAEAAFAVLQAARRSYEGQRDILDPRRRRPVHLVPGLVALAFSAAGLIVLDRLELRAIQGGAPLGPLVLAATAVWLGGAWRAALASREHQRREVAVLAGVAVLLALLLAVLDDLGPAASIRPLRWSACLPGIALSVLVIGLVVATSAVIERIEPACLHGLRRQCRRAESRHAAALRQACDDEECAAAAMTAWLTLVRVRAAATAAGDNAMLDWCLTYAEAIVLARAGHAAAAD